jgi:MFS family permease
MPSLPPALSSQGRPDADISCIKDRFFFHEHARKIGLWAGLFLLSPYCGPLFGNFIIAGTGSWRNVFWLVFAVCAFDLLLIVLFVDESWYRRDIPRWNSRVVGADCSDWWEFGKFECTRVTSSPS